MSRRAPLIAGAVSALLVVLAVVLLVIPKMGEVGEVRESVESAEDEEVALEAQLGSLQEAQAEAPETQREIERFEDKIPATADLPALFRLLQGRADRSAVDLFSFSPASPVPDPTGAFSVIPSQVTVTGGYFALDEFLFMLETLPRAAKVTMITLSPRTAAGTETTTAVTSTSQLQMQMTVEFFTTDSSAGPGSIPGPTEGVQAATGT